MEHGAQTPGDQSRPDAAPSGSEGSEVTPQSRSGPPASSGPPPTTPQLTEAESRTFGMLAHLSAFSGFIIPFGHLLGPLIVWLIKRDEHPFVDDQGREAVNFQLSMTLYYIAGLVLLLVLIGFLILPALVVFSIVVTVMAAVQANGGTRFRYPLCIRFIK